jgi:TonB family protein
MRYLAAVVAAVIGISQQGAPTDPYIPPRLVEGPAPATPGIAIIGGGQVLLDVKIDSAGQVDAIERLRVTPPYTDLVTDAVSGWRFSPSEVTTKDGRRKIESHVLVVGVYRPPALYLGGSLGEPPRDVGTPSTLIPFPKDLMPPAYPPTARGDATVVLEIDVGSEGDPRSVRVTRSGGGFDMAAIQAAERWSFTPARLADGTAVPAYVYVVMGFREPIVQGRGR